MASSREINVPFTLNLGQYVTDNNEVEQQIYSIVCNAFIDYSMKIYKSHNKHITNSIRLVLLKNINSVLEWVIHLYKILTTDTEKYGELLRTMPNLKSIVIFIHCSIIHSLQDQIDSISKDTEFMYSLMYNLRMLLKEHGLSKEEVQLNSIKWIFKKQYNHYRFDLGYGKVKSSKLAFKDSLCHAEFTRLNQMLNDLSQEECSICWEPIDDGYIVTKCYHIFHRKCLETWIQSSFVGQMECSCPMCKTPLINLN